MSEQLFEMTALKPFSNPNIESGRLNGAVLPGDKFKTTWLHAKELQQNGLANPVDANELATEPTDAIPPSNQISAPKLTEINARRAKAAAAKQTPPAETTPTATTPAAPAKAS